MGTYHFHYKHPLFGKGDWKNQPQNIKETKGGIRWDKSPYYVWFQCLLRSDKYRRICETQRGKNSKTYKDFGDVFAYEDNFKGWFRDDDRGIRLFAEPYGEVVTKQIQQSDAIDWDNPNLCVLQFDTIRHKAFIKKRVNRIIDAICKSSQPTSILSRAYIQFVIAPKDCEAYLRMLRVWDLTNQNIKTAEIHKLCYPQSNRSIEQRQIEAEKRLTAKGEQEVRAIDPLDAKLMLQKQRSQEVRRDYKRACKLIENAANGLFPKTS